MHFFFDDLELPHLIATQLTSSVSWKNRRAGYTLAGTPNNIHIVRSLRSALSRRIATLTPLSAHLHELEAQRAKLESEQNAAQIDELNLKIAELRRRLKTIPFLDPIDLRYMHYEPQPQPTSQAVMFCLMDVSGSMDEQRKDLAKRFFILLYLFLRHNYDRIEVVFIRHHTRAEEVDEDTFFHSRESGGTVVSSALELMHEIAQQRYALSEWNIYAAQVSDGDNWHDDSPKCEMLLADNILHYARYFAYIQVADEEQNLWLSYEHLAQNHPNFAMKKVMSVAEIYPVFRELFEKQQAGQYA